MPATTIPPSPRGVQLIVVFILLPTIATLSFVLRLLARRIINARLKADDGFILLALLFSWVAGIDGVVAVYHGSGQHANRIPPALVPRVRYHGYLYDIFRGFALLAAKISILLLYRRINPNANFRRAVHLVMAFCVAYSVAAIATVIFQCSPRRRYWIKALPGSCINTLTFYKISGTINMLSDIAIFLLPLPMVWKVRLPRRQKLAIIGVLAIGLVTVIACIFRLALVAGTLTSDATYTGFGAVVASTVETNLAIATANLTVLRPLFRGFQRFTEPKSSGYSASSNSRSKPASGRGPPRPDSSRRPIADQELSSVASKERGQPSFVTEDEGDRPWPASHV
ncbi:MAG: hypothetical protein M1826_004870 [Phylliscum demangeonii]|nr:MAG: hypothetical protein M1826_004870 [Phylliscum demangeonii]